MKIRPNFPIFYFIFGKVAGRGEGVQTGFFTRMELIYAVRFLYRYIHWHTVPPGESLHDHFFFNYTMIIKRGYARMVPMVSWGNKMYRHYLLIVQIIEYANS